MPLYYDHVRNFLLLLTATVNDIVLQLFQY